MKKNYLLFIFCFITYFINAQAPFITTWEVFSGDTIIVPIIEDDDVPDSYTIDFGDGTVLTGQSGSVSHTYANSGIYTITISGNFSRIRFIDNDDVVNATKLLTIEQWGDIEWTNMEAAFAGCSNLIIEATDVPDLNNVENMSNMFSNCSSLNQPLDNWDVSNVTNMAFMFLYASSFNQSLSNWDVSNVVGMDGMFSGATLFNQPLNSWNVSNVLNMSFMFSRADSFNKPLDNWDVSNVTHMAGMFSGTDLFNQALDSWDVSNVVNMSDMFDNAISFNQSLNSWDVSSVTNMSWMFWSAISFNQSLNNWNVSNVTNMEGLFNNASSFNQPLDNWDVSNVTNMRIILAVELGQTSSFNQDISTWSFNNDVDLEHFISNSDLSIANYDALLNRFKELGLENKAPGCAGLEYCDVETRDYLINELGWVILYDSLAEDCTAKTELFSIDQVSIYPNPVNDILYIETKSGVQLEEVTVYNLQGSQLIQQSQDFENINTESLSSGIYILNVQTDKGSIEYKLIKN
ncbi:BspA family leucine-rich repeat surface protein [Flavobacterium salilacus subsp. salilacus]|uniref:BspA family leucine-rich repeat surface protein n=1 Tax=Flavobacterium TaxID=237 RepID=UPI0013C33C0D|nr:MULTISPECIES: BspA family leucine-rich repeat surface protein [Flavobacterium]KAF2519310.1 BspA family leucine-rich repeat surface protein [Flavobacterium salilacus subsp. salilacus]MBE1613501.1 BspA family leucine-rich repeat surface protein [Flavobacterium sp. SaA2.13]